MDTKWSFCTIVVAMVTVLPTLPQTHAYRLSQGFTSRQILPDPEAPSEDGNEFTNISASPTNQEDEDGKAAQFATVTAALDLVNMLKHSNWNSDIGDVDIPATYDPYSDRDTILESILAMRHGRPKPLATLGTVLFSGLGVKGTESDAVTTDKRSNGLLSKRRIYDCDLRKVTLNTMIEYLKSGRICGIKVSMVRFGLGRK